MTFKQHFERWISVSKKLLVAFIMYLGDNLTDIQAETKTQHSWQRLWVLLLLIVGRIQRFTRGRCMESRGKSESAYWPWSWLWHEELLQRDGKGRCNALWKSQLYELSRYCRYVLYLHWRNYSAENWYLGYLPFHGRCKAELT